jgi:hypothetical protein
LNPLTVDTERQLPDELRNRRDTLQRGPTVDDVEHDGDSRGSDQWTSDEPQHRHAAWHQAGPIHQVAQDHSVRDTGEEAWPDQERPIIDCDESLAESGVCASRAFLSHVQEREEADDPDRDECALDEARCDVAQSEAFAIPPVDRVRHDGGADVGDDEDELEDSAQSHARGGVGAGSGDVVGVIPHRGVKDEVRGDRGDEGDHHQPARKGGNLPRVHWTTLASPAASRRTPDHRQGARTPPRLAIHPMTPRPLAPRSTRIRRIGHHFPQTACSKDGPGDDLFHEPEAHPKQSPPRPSPEVAVTASCPGERQDHLPLNLPRPYIGAPDRRAALPPCTRSVSPIDGSIGQMQSRSTAPSRLAWQNRVAIASWDSRVCPHASHTLIGASPFPCSGPGDWISNSVVIMVT